MATEKVYKHILLKLSGEALTGDESFGIDPKVLDQMALEIGQLVGIGVQVGLVVGGGNLFRGAALQSAGLDRVTGDHMGMLATVMNALALRDALEVSPGNKSVLALLEEEHVRKLVREGGECAPAVALLLRLSFERAESKRDVHDQSRIHI